MIGDIHGSHKGLVQVLERAKFDYEVDELISLGDVVDGWPETAECLDELMSIKNLIFILGNHDSWCLSYYNHNLKMDHIKTWCSHGGIATVISLEKNIHKITEYMNFLESAKFYHILDGNKIFAHASIPSAEQELEKAEEFKFTWDRELIKRASHRRQKKSIDDRWEEIYVGHTPVNYFKIDHLLPQKWANLWAMDTASCFEGVISMMDIDTKEVFQSDECCKLYPDHPGRNGITYNEMLKK